MKSKIIYILSHPVGILLKEIKPYIIVISFLLPLKCKCQDIYIDHVISVVSNIDSASQFYHDNGFTIKKGQLHQNGLINAHIKFKNNTSCELMSVLGTPGDKMAKEYAELLEKGEGFVFIAISGIETSEMKKRLLGLNIKHTVITGPQWNYITFSDTPEIKHFFFIENKIDIKDSDTILTHKNKTENIKEVYVEGNDKVVTFLKGIGIEHLGKNSDSEFGEGEIFLTKTGKIIIIPKKDQNKRPRIRALSFGDENDAVTFKMIFN